MQLARHMRPAGRVFETPVSGIDYLFTYTMENISTYLLFNYINLL